MFVLMEVRERGFSFHIASEIKTESFISSWNWKQPLLEKIYMEKKAVLCFVFLI